MLIPMLAEHVRLIRDGRKTATLRSCKEIYPLGLNELHDGTRIFLTSRTLVEVGEEGIQNLDTPSRPIDATALAVQEGYSRWHEVVRVLKRMRHRLPKEMWLYEFSVTR